MEILQKMPGMADVRMKVAGYLGGKDHKWFKALRKRISRIGLDRTCFLANSPRRSTTAPSHSDTIRMIWLLAIAVLSLIFGGAATPRL